MRFRTVEPVPGSYLEQIGFLWHTDNDNTPYIDTSVIEVSQQEAEAYARAANELYDMYIKAGEYVIQNNLFHDIGIPFNLVEIIKISWENDDHWHIYGRFDFAGGIDGQQIKLLEFNADTPTSLFETMILQWALLKYNKMDNEQQFNFIYEAILENFRRLNGNSILFSSIYGSVEEEMTTRLLESIAADAGFKTNFEFANRVAFSDSEGFFAQNTRYDYWFKLIPWEMIAIEEDELAKILTNIVKNRAGIVINPAYTLMFQSKGMLKILWELFPNHPLLLETSYKPLNRKQIQKPIFGREGGGISILDEHGNRIFSENGFFGDRYIYQEYTELPKDEYGNRYQAGVFFAFEACGLGFRKGGEILNNTSKFVGHLVY